MISSDPSSQMRGGLRTSFIGWVIDKHLSYWGATLRIVGIKGLGGVAPPANQPAASRLHLYRTRCWPCRERQRPSALLIVV